MLDALRKGAATWVAKIFIGILVLSFAVWGIADIFGGYGQQKLGSVGDVDISQGDYQRAYQNEIRAMSNTLRRQITPQMARNLGIESRVLTRLVAGAALDAHANRLGLGVSEETLADLIRSDEQFQDSSGKFSRLSLDQALRNAGITEEGYIADRRKGAVRGQITNMFADAPVLTKTMLGAWNKYWNATREVEYFVLTEKSIDEIKPAEEAELKSFYEDNKSSFKAPEYRDLDVLIVDPNLLKDAIEVKDEDVKTSYDSNISLYTVPEKRKIEQISFPSKEAAEAAAKKLKEGAKFIDVAKEAGIPEADLSLGTVSKEELFDKKIAEAAFALEKNKTSGPVEGKLSTVIVRVTDIVPGLTRSFDEMKKKIREDLQKEKATDKILDLYDIIEDARAGGATLKEIAEKNNLKHVAATTDQLGKDQSGKEIADLTSRRSILSGAFESDVDVENDAVELFAGAYAWFVVTKVTPSRILTFEEAKADVEKQWKAQQVRTKLAEKAKELVEKGNNGETIEVLAKSVKAKVEKPISFRRSDNLKKFSKTAIGMAFTMDIGKFNSAIQDQDEGQGRLVFTLKKVNAPETLAVDNKKKFEDQISGDVVDDLLAQYLTALQKDLGMSINQQVVDRLTGRSSQN